MQPYLIEAPLFLQRRFEMPDVVEWTFFVFALITLPFYCLLLSVIREAAFHEKRSSASFYLICEVVGWVDVACILNNYLTYQFPKWGLFSEFYLSVGTPLLRIGFFISWGSGVAQVHSTILLAFNRFTAVVFVQKHDQLWRRSSRPFIYAFVLVPASLLASATFFSPVDYDPIEGGGLVQKLKNKTLSHIFFGAVGLFMIVYSALIFAMYVIVLYALHQHKKKTTIAATAITPAYTNRAQIQKRREQRLLIMSLFVCGVQLIVTTYIIMKFVFGSTFDPALNIYNFLDVIYSSVNVYLLFAFSEVLRLRMLRRMFACFRFLVAAPSSSRSPVFLTKTHPMKGATVG